MSKKINHLFDECKNNDLHCSITHQRNNDFSIEIYTGYVDSYKSVYYTDGHIKLKKAVNEAIKFILTYDSRTI